MRKLRRSLSAQQQSDAAAGLCQQITDWTPFTSARRIALYRANDCEIDPDMIFKLALQKQIECFLPIVIINTELAHPNSLQFARYDMQTRFKTSKFGIDEPDFEAGQVIGADQLDLALMPLVGFDRQGNRIGMGGGYYDSTFSFKNASNMAQSPQLVGLAHAAQQVEHIDSEPWDIPLSAVITDTHIYSMVVPG